jgi:two-component system response regulator FixJ
MAGSTVFVIDDQPAVRDALGEMLGAFGYAVELHPSVESFLGALDASRVGCVVADVRMPGIDGIQLVRELARRKVELPVVVISGHADVAMAVEAIKAGAEDFIEKPIDDVQLVAAINRGLARIAERRQELSSTQELRERFERLTPREIEVFDLVVEGYTSQAIAGLLEISPRTVERYRAQLMEKMRAGSVAVLVRQAIRLARITP